MKKAARATPALTVDDIRRATLVLVAHDDVAAAVSRIDHGREIIAVRNNDEIRVAMQVVHVADAIIAAPELRDGGSVTKTLQLLRRRWPGVSTSWVGRYARPERPPFPGSRGIRLDGPFDGDMRGLANLVAERAREGGERRDAEHRLGLAFAADLAFKEHVPATVICVLLAHGLPDRHLHEVLGRDRTAFTRYVSEAIYPAIGGPTLVDLVQQLRAFERDSHGRRRTSRSSQQTLRSV